LVKKKKGEAHIRLICKEKKTHGRLGGGVEKGGMNKKKV